MANLNETPQWEPGIRQIETTDAVVGGAPNISLGQGIPNIGPQQLANRTAYLKAQLEAGLAALAMLNKIKTVDGPGSGLDADTVDGRHYSQIVTDIIDAITDAAPGTLDTLNELASALGDDANFAATMTSALAGKLPIGGKAADANLLDGINSAAFARKDTGALQTFTGGVRTEAGSFISNAPDGQDANLLFIDNGGAIRGLIQWDRSTGNLQIHRRDGGGTDGALEIGNEGLLSIDGNLVWSDKDAAKVFGANGYQVLPSGTIFQWGTANAVNGGTITFPIAFPNACLNVFPIDNNVGAAAINAHNVGVSDRNTNNFIVSVFNLDGTPANIASGVRWFAVGH